jgi:hypothetical protein
MLCNSKCQDHLIIFLPFATRALQIATMRGACAAAYNFDRINVP